MLQNQIMSMVRQVLPAVGMLLAMLGFTSNQVGAWLPLIEQIAGVLAILGSGVWSWLTHSKTATIAAAAKVSEVKAMTVSDPKLATAALAADPSVNVTTK